jgi:YaiO family outer membrane protein
MIKKHLHIAIIILLACVYSVNGQDVSALEVNVSSFETAYKLAYDGKNAQANRMLGDFIIESPDNQEAKSLLASTYSWKGDYNKARSDFNVLLSKNKTDKDVWISAIKNELYAKNYATALGLSNKALVYFQEDKELLRLKSLAFSGVNEYSYKNDGWFNVESNIETNFKTSSKARNNLVEKTEADSTLFVRKTPVTEEKLKNRIVVNSSVTVFDQRFDPVVSSSISYKRQTKYGTIIPRLNNSNRLGKNGLQFDIDLYPKIAKGFYAYVNYGYSNSELYPNHKVGGDIYYNHKSGFEFSGGGRYISFATRNVKSITNSVGYYRGNYYFSLRSFITPGVNDKLTNASGNILVRKYLKDAENYVGVNFGVGFSPELRQFSSGDQILAETLLYIESQRLSCEYQFTSKNNLSSYRTNIGVLRQEQSFDPGSFFYSISAGLTYQFNF